MDSLNASSLSNPAACPARPPADVDAEANVCFNIYRGEQLTWKYHGWVPLPEPGGSDHEWTGTGPSAAWGKRSKQLLLLGARRWPGKTSFRRPIGSRRNSAAPPSIARRFAFDLSLQVALGDIRRAESVNGFSQVAVGAANAVPFRVPGGLLTAITNITTTKDNVFSAVPEIRLGVNYQLTRCIRVGVGYDIVYASNVIRPGTMIDPVVNPTLTPFRTEFGLPLGTARPTQIFHGTDYWAQGVNWSVTLQF